MLSCWGTGERFSRYGKKLSRPQCWLRWIPCECHNSGESVQWLGRSYVKSYESTSSAKKDKNHMLMCYGTWAYLGIQTMFNFKDRPILTVIFFFSLAVELSLFLFLSIVSINYHVWPFEFLQSSPSGKLIALTVWIFGFIVIACMRIFQDKRL